jgi:hypothetical protein
MILSTHGIVGSQIQSFVGLLDTYPNAAAAYSVRKLRTAYTGSAIRVRRSSDNTEQNIGFTALGNLDTSALTSFCGSGNGFVTTWYDQSGNGRNAINTTAANQPQIVSSGAIINVNSKPSIRFQDSTDFLRCVTATGTSTTNTMATVQKFNTPLTGYRVIMSIGDTSGVCYAFLGWGATGFLNRGIYTSSNQSLDGAYTANQEIWGSTTASLSAKFWFNGTSQTITNPNTTYTANLNDIQIGNDTYSSALIGNIQEAVYWATTQSDSNLVGINTNQNTYYAVY